MLVGVAIERVARRLGLLAVVVGQGGRVGLVVVVVACVVGVVVRLGFGSCVAEGMTRVG